MYILLAYRKTILSLPRNNTADWDLICMMLLFIYNHTSTLNVDVLHKGTLRISIKKGLAFWDTVWGLFTQRFWDVIVVHIYDDDDIPFWSWASTREQFLTKSNISVQTCWSLIMYKRYCASFWHFEHLFGNLSDMYWLTTYIICIQILKNVKQTFLEKQKKKKKKEQPLKSLKKEYLIEILHKNW